MAKRSSTKSGAGNGDWRSRQVVVDFNDKLRAEYLDWAGLHPSISWGDFVRVCDGGWKISFSFSEFYNCYYGSCTGRTEDTGYNGYTVSIRHADFDKLASILYFTIAVLCADGRIEIAAQSNAYDW